MVWPTDSDHKLSEYDAMELPGQQLPAANASNSLDHLLKLDMRSPPGCQRLTGIFVTMGKSTYDIEVMENLISAGMNIALLNFSYGSKEEHIETIKMLRQATKNFSERMGKNYPLAIAARLPGRKIRTGKIADTYGDTVELKTEETVRLTTDETYQERCSPYTIYIDFMYFAEQVKKNNIIFLDNERIMLKVEFISATTLTCNIERGGLLSSYRDVFVPNVEFDMPNYTERDKAIIDMCTYHQVDVMIAPFVNNAKAITELRDLLGSKGKRMSIVANIMTTAGFQNFDEIIKVTDGIMITRQELGSDITPKKLVIAQKNLIARANKANIPISISAHLLTSMTKRKVPMRSELLDIANCVLDGVDALVLSGETAIGSYPVETVTCMSNACKEAEACVFTKQIFNNLLEDTPLPCDQATGTAICAVLAAQRSIAAAIIVITTTGTTATLVSKYKPRCPIIAVTRYPPIAKSLHLWRGIVPVIYEDIPDPDWAIDLEQRINYCTRWIIERGFVRVGDPLIVISGWRQGTGFTNTLRIVYATSDVVA